MIEKQDSGTKVRFTDTPENTARFVAGAGDNLLSKNVLRLERVKQEGSISTFIALIRC